MIDTSRSKAAQLANGYFQTGTGPTTVLILGSCRTLHYVNYLQIWNEMSGNKLTILRIDPWDWHWNERDELVDLEAALTTCEHDSRILDALRRTDIFIHEHFRYFGMFCTDTKEQKNIYRFGLNPSADICFPNFHDRFVLFQDQVSFNEAISRTIRISGGSPDALTFDAMKFLGLQSLEKFYDVCRMSSFPEMAEHFRENWTHTRFFSNGNHINKNFALYLFRQMNDRFLHLPLDESFWQSANQVDLFSTPRTAVTKWDLDAYGLDWGEPIEELKL